MGFYTDQMTKEIEEVARFHYVDHRLTKAWNENRKGGELRLLTGWVWVSRKDATLHRGGFKTRSVAMRDAFYTLIQHIEAPTLMRVVVRKPKATIDERRAAA